MLNRSDRPLLVFGCSAAAATYVVSTALVKSGAIRRGTVKASITAFRILTPLAFLRVLFDVVQLARKAPWSLRRLLRHILTTWALAEVVFFFYIRWCSRQLNSQTTRRWRAVGLHSSEEKRTRSLERYLHMITQIYMGGDLNSDANVARPAKMSKVQKVTTSPGSLSSMGIRRVSSSAIFNKILDAGARTISMESLDGSLGVGRQMSCGNLLKDLDARQKSGADFSISHEELLRLKWIEMCGWFHGEGRGDFEDPASWLRRGNIEEWIAHYFFRGSSPAELPAPEREELRRLTGRMLEHLGLPDLPDGINMQVHSYRLLADPLPYQHRPLAIYALNVLGVPLLTRQVMLSLGFVHERLGSLCYWHRGPQVCGSQGVFDIAGGRQVPLILLHGLGVGLLPYYAFVRWLSQHYSYHIYVPELFFLASRPYENPPSAREVVAQLQAMLTVHGHQAGHFLGHSFGCVVAGWMQKLSPSSVQCLTLMEPALFIIMHSDTVAGILYTQPETCLELFYRYFVFRELFTVNLLCRNFFWEQNTMYPEEVCVPMLIELASDDAVIASRSVRRILENERQQRRATARDQKIASRLAAAKTAAGSSSDLRHDPLCAQRNSSQMVATSNATLEVHWCEGFFHGMILGHKKECKRLFRKMAQLMENLDVAETK